MILWVGGLRPCKERTGMSGLEFLYISREVKLHKGGVYFSL